MVSNHAIGLRIVGVLAVMAAQVVTAGKLVAQLGRRKRAEMSERASEARMTLAMESARLGIWERDVKRDIIWATEQWRQLFGFTAEEPITLQTFLGRLHPEDREGLRAIIQATLERRSEYELEYRIILPDQSVRWIASRGRVISRDGHGSPERTLGASMDITERKRSEEALLESEARFRGVANTAPVMIWMSGPDQKCEYFNKPWLDFTGRTLEQELGDGWAEGVYSDDLQRCLKVHAESFDARKPFEIEYRLRHKDGQYRWVLDCGVPRFMADGSFAGYIGSCLDIAGRKEAELQLQEQRRELTHLSRVAIVGELTGALAHELNQPLTAILSNAQAAHRRLAQEPADLAEIRDILADIISEDKRAGEIIRRLRALLKKGEMQLQPVSLNELAGDTLLLAHGDFVSRGIVVYAELATDLPAVRGDRVQLQQVLLNLIGNACDAMRHNAPDDRRLGIATTANGNGTLEIVIIDQGPGIAAKTGDRLFEPFVTTKVEGLGLGLTICRTIVNAHGGRLWAENNAVRGAAFHVSLPALAGELTS